MTTATRRAAHGRRPASTPIRSAVATAAAADSEKSIGTTTHFTGKTGTRVARSGDGSLVDVGTGFSATFAPHTATY